MHGRAIRSPDFKPVQLGKRRPDSPGSCGPQFPRLEPAAQTAQTSDIATSPGEPHADAVDERCAATQLSDEGPARLVKTKGYSTTMAISTLKNMLVGQLLRRGDGVISLPASRRHNRLFAAGGAGRTKVMSSGVKIEKLDDDYDPLDDTCIKAFVRLLAARAHSEAGNPTA